MTPRRTVLLVTSNGAGMGHLARQTSIAIALRDSGFEPVLLSMSTAVPTVMGATGIRGEYLPGRSRAWVTEGRWHSYVRRRLILLTREIDAAAVVFDGVAPYRGIITARRDLPGVPFVWSRRGMWKPGVNVRSLRTSPWFDVIVEPGDLGSAQDQGATAQRADALRVEPISLWRGRNHALDRASAATALGLDASRPTLLVTLGAGNLDDTSAPGVAAARAGLDAGWQVALTHAPISTSDRAAHAPDDVRVLRGVFPLTDYLGAFDAAVAAGGYNAVHELLPATLPTVLVPNRAAATDDQAARVRGVVRRGLAIEAAAERPDDLGRTVLALLSDEQGRGSLSRACAALPDLTGAAQTARIVCDLVDPAMARDTATTEDHATHPTRPTRSTWRPPRVDLDGARFTTQAAARGALGEPRWESLRRRAGRAPRHGICRPLPVRFSPGGDPNPEDLIVTTDAADVTGSPRPIVEHVIADSSPGYRADRAALARAYVSPQE